jgi:hypothetical protein
MLIVYQIRTNRSKDKMQLPTQEYGKDMKEVGFVLSDCCFTTTWEMFQLYYDNKLHSMKWLWCPFVIDQHVHAYSSLIFTVITHRNKSVGRHVDLNTLISTHLIPGQPSLKYCVLIREAANTDLSLWFDPTRAQTQSISLGTSTLTITPPMQLVRFGNSI